MPLPDELPADLYSPDGVKRSADTPADYWNLVARGFSADPPEAQDEEAPVAEQPVDNTQPAAQQEQRSRRQVRTSSETPNDLTTNAGTNQT